MAKPGPNGSVNENKMANGIEDDSAENLAMLDDLGTMKTYNHYPTGCKFSIGGEGLCVGRDSGEAVTDDYPGTSPWRFTGGTMDRVRVDVSGKPYVDLEHEAVAMMARE